MNAPRQIVRNASRRPVELHFADRIEVLLPEATVECDADQIGSAAMAPLLASGILTQFDAPPPRPPRTRAKATKRANPARARGKAAAQNSGKTPSRDPSKGHKSKVTAPAPPATKRSTTKSDQPTKSSGDPT